MIDRVKLHLKAGDGGRGCVAWRREKFYPNGGPFGGDGGNGGDIYFAVDTNETTLIKLRFTKTVKAGNGSPGLIKKMHGKSGDDIPLYARIIKVTDSYDAMISKRPGREQLSPADAIEYMMAMAGAEFDPKLVNIFLRRMAVYPIGCEVLLSNGQHGIVAKNFRDFSLRPLVRIVETGGMLNLRDDPEGLSITIGRMIM